VTPSGTAVGAFAESTPGIGGQEATSAPSFARSSRRAAVEHPLDASREITRDLGSPLYRYQAYPASPPRGDASQLDVRHAGGQIAAVTSSAAEPECVIVDESMAAIFATTIVV
jgi:hypothetical protein